MTDEALETSEEDAIEAALSKVSRLATLPATSLRIIDMLDNPNATANQLEQLVSSDPVLSARVLKVVNSSFYGMPASVNSIKQAIVILGTGGLRNIALAASLARLFGGTPASGEFDPQGPWQHSAAVGAAARLICEHIEGDADEMFLAGLLHDVGTVIALQALRQQFQRLVKRRVGFPNEPYEDAERKCLGATHEQFGVALCRSWNFPEAMTATVEFHHRPDQAPEEFRRNAQIICLADHIAAAARIGYCSTASDAELPARIVEDLGLTDDQLADIRERLPEMVELANQIV